MKKYWHSTFFLLFLPLIGCISSSDYFEIYNPINMAICGVQSSHPVTLDGLVKEEATNTTSVIFVSKQTPNIEEARKVFVDLVETFNYHLLQGPISEMPKKVVIALVFKNATDPTSPSTVIRSTDNMVSYLHKNKDTYDTIYQEHWSVSWQIVHENE